MNDEIPPKKGEKMIKKQQGFGLVQILLLIVVIGIIGGTGWYVYGEKNATKKTITNFDECIAAGNPVMESYPEQCSANGQTFVKEYPATQDANNKNVLKIEEWGVQLIEPDSEDDAYYIVETDGQGEGTVTLYSRKADQITNSKGKSCKGEYVAYLRRLKPSTESTGPFDTIKEIDRYVYSVTSHKEYLMECADDGSNGDETILDQFREIQQTYEIMAKTVEKIQ